MASSPRSIERCKRLKIRRKSLTQDGGARPGWPMDQLLTKFGHKTLALQPHQLAVKDPIHDQLISLGPRSSAVGSWGSVQPQYWPNCGIFSRHLAAKRICPKELLTSHGGSVTVLTTPAIKPLSDTSSFHSSHQCSKHTVPPLWKLIF